VLKQPEFEMSNGPKSFGGRPAADTAEQTETGAAAAPELTALLLEEIASQAFAACDLLQELIGEAPAGSVGVHLFGLAAIVEKMGLLADLGLGAQGRLQMVGDPAAWLLSPKIRAALHQESAGGAA